MFNYIIKDRLFIKNNKKNKFLYISNPPKNNNKNNNLISPSSTIKNFDLISNESEKKIDLIKQNQININKYNKNSDIESKISFDKEKIFLKTSNSSNNFSINNSENGKKNNYENNIKLNIFENFWCNVLMSIDSDNSKFKNIENALDKIKLIQDLFDISTYINILFDIMRLKKIIFNKKELMLFENIYFTFDELKNYLKFSNNEEFINDEEKLIKLIKDFDNQKSSKLCKTMIDFLKIQIDSHFEKF